MGDRILSEILERSAVGYAACAADSMLERAPDGSAKFPRDFPVWKTYLTQRILELSAAVHAERPEMFASSVDWVRKACVARNVSDAELRVALKSLRTVLQSRLPEAFRETACRYVDSGLAVLEREDASTHMGLDPRSPDGRIALSYIAAVLEGDADRAAHLVLDAFSDGVDLDRAYNGILLPAQREVGALWHTGQLTIAEEHFVTETTRRVMAVLAFRAPRAAANGKTMIAASIEGNVHDVAVRALADLFEVAGWRAVCLGGNVPPAEIARAVQFFGADLLALSASLETQLKILGETVGVLRKDAPAELKILIGGRPLACLPELWQEIGADGQTLDVGQAVALATAFFE